MNTKGADQTARMRSLICIFGNCIQQNQVFPRLGPKINTHFIFVVLVQMYVVLQSDTDMD